MDDTLRIRRMPARAALQLKSWRSEHATGAMPVVLAQRRLPSKLGATLPGPVRVLCTGPAEWLIVSQGGEGIREVAADLPVEGLVAVDLSDGLVTIDVQGSAARELLSKGCGLDLHPRTFPAGTCARTRFARIPVLIDCVDDSPRFEVVVAKSYASYLYEWLSDASVDCLP